jgi:hypothetical protein
MCLNDKELLFRNRLSDDYNKILTLSAFMLAKKKNHRLPLSVKPKDDVLLDSNENLNRRIAMLHDKNFPESFKEASNVWNLICMNEDPTFRLLRIRTLQIIIESLIELFELDQVPDWLQRLNTLDPNSFDTEWYNLFYLVKSNVSEAELVEPLRSIFEILCLNYDDNDPSKNEQRDRLNVLRELRSQLFQDTWQDNVESLLLDLSQVKIAEPLPLIHSPKPKQSFTIMGMKCEGVSIPLNE